MYPYKQQNPDDFTCMFHWFHLCKIIHKHLQLLFFEAVWNSQLLSLHWINFLAYSKRSEIFKRWKSYQYYLAHPGYNLVTIAENHRIRNPVFSNITTFRNKFIFCDVCLIQNPLNSVNIMDRLRYPFNMFYVWDLPQIPLSQDIVVSIANQNLPLDQVLSILHYAEWIHSRLNVNINRYRLSTD